MKLLEFFYPKLLLQKNEVLQQIDKLQAAYDELSIKLRDRRSKLARQNEIVKDMHNLIEGKRQMLNSLDQSIFDNTNKKRRLEKDILIAKTELKETNVKLDASNSDLIEFEVKHYDLKNKAEEIDKFISHWENTTQDNLLVIDEHIKDRVKEINSTYSRISDALGKSNRDKFKEMLGHSDWHILLPFKSNFGDSIIDAHQQIEETNGFFWWAKFNRQLNTNDGNYKSLEPYGESLTIKDHADLITAITNQIDERSKSNQHVNVFLCDPDPEPSLYVAKLHKMATMSKEQNLLPWDDEANNCVCNYVPNYLLESGHTMNVCRKDLRKCNPRFLGTFYFKLSDVEELPFHEIRKLHNLFSGSSMTFTIPVSYPLFVTNGIEHPYFKESEYSKEECKTLLNNSKEGEFNALKFCASTIEQLTELPDEAIMPIFRGLKMLNACSQSWKSGPFEFSELGRYVSPDSETTINKYGSERTFRCPDGNIRTFTLHFKAGIKWRIYFFPYKYGLLYIGYIGRHLRIATR